MLKRAFSKLKLEHVVIEKGQFHQERVTPSIADEMEVCMLAVACN
jgi:ATP-dependent DNA helicase